MLPLGVAVLLVAVTSGQGGGVAEAAQCACARVNVHLRQGPGTSYPNVHTLLGSQCLPHDGQSQAGGSYTWLHLTFNGQSVWAASDYMYVQDCSDSQMSSTSGTADRHDYRGDVQLPGCPQIVKRSEWGALPPKSAPDYMTGQPIYVFLHHGAGSECFDKQDCTHHVQQYQTFHQNGRGWNDIGYNFVVGEDGNAYEARGWDAVGAHTKGYNTNGIAISIIGDFTSHIPNDAALNTVRQLIQCGLDNGKISPHYTLKGHRDVGVTACPGQKYYDLIQSWPHYVAHDGLWHA